MKTKINIVVDLSSVDKIDTRQFLFNRTFVRECTLQVYDIQRVIKWEIIYTTWPSVDGTTVGTCVYKTANIKGHALHVALFNGCCLKRY